MYFTFKVTPTTFWLRCINLSKCTKFCSIDNLEVADKYFGLFTKNNFMGWQIQGLEDGIPGNIWVLYWNLLIQILLVSIGAHMLYLYWLVLGGLC